MRTVNVNNKSFTIKSAVDAFLAQVKIDYTVDKLAAPGWITLIFGHPGTKKTWIALFLAICVAIGKDWLGFKTKQTKVLWIDEETGDQSIGRRIRMVIRGVLGDDQTPIDYISLHGFKLDNPKQSEDTLELTTIVNNGGYGLIVIDSLADIMSGDENLVKDVRPVFQNLKIVANTTNAAIVIIHHSNKAGSYRGSSFIKGFIDVMIQVESENGSDLISFHTEKIREDERQAWSTKAVWEPDQFYLQPSQAKVKPVFSIAEIFVMEFLDTNKAANVDTIANSADVCSDLSARKAVYGLAKRGITERIPHPGKKAVYTLTAQGIAEVKTL